MLNNVAYAKLSVPTNRIRYDEGKRIYIINCTRCHNVDPSKAGSVGPDITTTPLDAFTSKVSQGTYPSGYTPKRRSKNMPTFLELTNKIDVLYDYVRSFK